MVFPSGWAHHTRFSGLFHHEVPVNMACCDEEEVLTAGSRCLAPKCGRNGSENRVISPKALWFLYGVYHHFYSFLLLHGRYTPFPDTLYKWEIIEHWILWAYFQTPGCRHPLKWRQALCRVDVHRIDPNPRFFHFTISSPKDSTAVKVFFVVFPCCQSMDNLSYSEHVFWHLWGI